MTKTAGPFDPFRKQLGAFTRGAKPIDDGDAEAVHRTRVASRRLREMLPVLGLDSAATLKLGRRLKKVTNRLGEVRELDVLTLMIQELSDDPRHSSTALKQVGTAVQRDRARVRTRLAARVPFEKIRRLARHLRRAVRQHETDGERSGLQRSTPGSSHAWVWAVDARVTRRAMGVCSAIETAGSLYVLERLHDVRIAVKKLRYAMELAAEARRQRGSRDIAALKAAQDLLGRLHDLEVLNGRARQEQASLAPPTLAVWRELDSLIRTLGDDCRALHARYMHQRAKLAEIAERLCETREHARVNRRAVGADAG